MWTRGTLTHQYTTAATARPVGRTGAGLVPMQRGGSPSVALPPPVVMHDPSDPTTWSVPVRWTR